MRKMTLKHPGGKTGATKKTVKRGKTRVTAAPKWGAGVKGAIRKVRPTTTAKR